MRIRYILLTALFTALASTGAVAEKRVALVIGNSAYQNVPKLTNPANDASMMAATLKKSGFDSVVQRSDVTKDTMRRALRDFADQARDADIAIAGGNGKFAVYVNGVHQKVVSESAAVLAVMDAVRGWSPVVP